MRNETWSMGCDSCACKIAMAAKLKDVSGGAELGGSLTRGISRVQGKPQLTDADPPGGNQQFYV